MATEITVIDARSSSPDTAYVCVFWLVAPVNRTIALPNFVSAVPNTDPTILAALRAGTLVEQVWSSGLLVSNTTGAALKALAVAAYNAAQTALTATNPPLNVIGVTFNGTTWSA